MRPRLGGHLFVFLCSWGFVLTQDYSSVYLEQSWAFPEQESSSLIFKDTRGQVDGTRVSALFLRSLNTSAATSGEATFLREHDQTHFTFPALRPHAGAGAPDVTDRDTLVNLAKASWDSYIPSPSNEDWYGLDGLNWVRPPVCVARDVCCRAAGALTESPLIPILDLSDLPIWLETWTGWPSWSSLPEL